MLDVKGTCLFERVNLSIRTHIHQHPSVHTYTFIRILHVSPLRSTLTESDLPAIMTVIDRMLKRSPEHSMRAVAHFLKHMQIQLSPNHVEKFISMFKPQFQSAREGEMINTTICLFGVSMCPMSGLLYL